MNVIDIMWYYTAQKNGICRWKKWPMKLLKTLVRRLLEDNKLRVLIMKELMMVG